MSQENLKIPVSELKPGMYVSRLDRPWLDSPFLFQGFEISGPEEVAQLQECCHYVFVDPEESSIAVSPSEAVHIANKATPEQQLQLVLKFEAQEKITLKNLSTEVKHALTVHLKARKYIKGLLHDIRMGHAIDTESAQRLVSQMADSIVRNSTALLWLTQLKDKDEYTSIHSLNVCILALAFGSSMNLSSEQLNILGTGALLHDIGKLRVPAGLLNKPEKLSPEEFQQMKSHCELGYQLLKDRRLHPDSLDIIRHHHERADGSGYPDGLVKERIRPLTKMVSIVDVYDAVTTRRVYHNESSPFEALNAMYRKTTESFDHDLVEKFIKCVGIYPIGSVVQLNTGQIGVVVSFTEQHRLLPTLLLILDEKQQPYPQHKILNLANPRWQAQNINLQINGIINPSEYDIDLTRLFLEESLRP